MKALRTTDQLGGPAWAAISPGRSTRARRRESKSTKEAAAAIVSLSQQAGRQNKSLGKGTSAQLDGCAFISGLLASDRDDIKAGRDGTGRDGAGRCGGHGSSADSEPAPVAPRRIVSCHASVPAFGFGTHWQNSRHRQEKTLGGGKTTAPVKQTVSLDGRLPVRET